MILAVLYGLVTNKKIELSSPSLSTLVAIEEVSTRHKLKALTRILPKQAQYFGLFNFLAEEFGTSRTGNSLKFVFKSSLPLYRVDSWFLSLLQGVET